MKYNKGFTLAEVLAVLTIIGIMIGITVPIVSSSINHSKQSLYQDQEKIILRSAVDWAEANVSVLPDNSEDTLAITIGLLKANGFLHKSLTNPKTGYLFPDDMIINISYNSDSKIPDDNTKYNGNYKFAIDTQSGHNLSLTTDIKAIQLNICDDTDGHNSSIDQCITNNLDKIYKGIDTSYNLSYRDRGGKNIDDTLVDYIYKSQTISSIDMSKYGFYYVYYNAVNNNQVVPDSLKIFIINDTEPPTIIDDNYIKEYHKNDIIDLNQNISCSDNSGYCKINILGNVNPSIEGNYIVTYIASDRSGNTSKKKKIIKIKA